MLTIQRPMTSSISTNAQQMARAEMLITHKCAIGNTDAMRDWAIDYILHVMETKNWSMNELASRAGVAASTINRPLREPDYPHQLSRKTLEKIFSASGIDPESFVPKELSEERTSFIGRRPETQADRALRALDTDQVPSTPTSALARNQIKVAVVGPVAQIVATVDREGIARLRQKLDAIEQMLDD